mgnify:CR=1 FL=1
MMPHIYCEASRERGKHPISQPVQNEQNAANGNKALRPMPTNGSNVKIEDLVLQEIAVSPGGRDLQTVVKSLQQKGKDENTIREALWKLIARNQVDFTKTLKLEMVP